MKVAKFGGSSLADASQIKKVCDIVTSDKERKVVVVSAPGKGASDSQKVTDMLICAAEAALKYGKEAVMKRLNIYRQVQESRTGSGSPRSCRKFPNP